MDMSPKKRLGRPPVIAGGSTVVAVHVPVAHHKLLQAEAAEKCWPVSQVLRQAVAQYVTRK